MARDWTNMKERRLGWDVRDQCRGLVSEGRLGDGSRCVAVKRMAASWERESRMMQMLE